LLIFPFFLSVFFHPVFFFSKAAHFYETKVTSVHQLLLFFFSSVSSLFASFGFVHCVLLAG